MAWPALHHHRGYIHEEKVTNKKKKKIKWQQLPGTTLSNSRALLTAKQPTACKMKKEGERKIIQEGKHAIPPYMSTNLVSQFGKERIAALSKELVKEKKGGNVSRGEVGATECVSKTKMEYIRPSWYHREQGRCASLKKSRPGEGKTSNRPVAVQGPGFSKPRRNARTLADRACREDPGSARGKKKRGKRKERNQKKHATATNSEALPTIITKPKTKATP